MTNEWFFVLGTVCFLTTTILNLLRIFNILDIVHNEKRKV